LLHCLPLLLCAFGPPRIGDRWSLPSFEVAEPQLKAIKAQAMPPLLARAALLVDFASGKELWAKASHQRLAPASTTKMMTALLTLEDGKLDADGPVSALAASEPCTCMGVTAGERFTTRELLYGLLLPSGNDAAVALAQREGPSLQGFVDRMNTRAKELGLAETHFVNPHGLDDPAHLSSASDLTKLARYALQTQPLFDQYVMTKHMSLAANADHPLVDLDNLNQLLGSYPGADGVKTGTTAAAGQSVVGAATRENHRLLIVVLGSTDRYADARAMLDKGFAGYTWLRPDLYFPVAMPVLVRDTAEAVVPRWQASQVQAFLDPDGMQATFSVAGRDVLDVPLAPLS
jgi:D-alanyl-D-alanine carboxypeptidase (penicillin-binding protein 5/6)